MTFPLSINPHVTKLSVSPTLKINMKLRALKEKGHSVSHFGFGQSPFRAPDLLEQSLQECVHKNGYLPTQGLPELRQAIAQWSQSTFKMDFDPENVFVGPGSKECLFDLLYLIEGSVLIPKGSWVSYQPIATLLNKPFEVLDTDVDKGYKLSASTLDTACQQIAGPKILILNNPNNPTGQILNDDELAELANVCEKHKVIVISDEIYALVTFEQQPFASIQHHYPEGTIVTNGLSKAFSAGGYRLGFAMLPASMANLRQPYNTLISETYSGVASPIQYAALSVFNQFEKIKPYVHCCNQIHKWVLERTHQRLSQIGFRAPKPEGAFYLLADLESYRKPLAKLGIHNGQTLCDYVLDKYAVALLSAHHFGFDPSYLGFRLSPVDYDGAAVLNQFSAENADKEFANWFTNIKSGLDHLEDFVHSLNE